MLIFIIHISHLNLKWCALILLFDLTVMRSFDEMEKWMFRMIKMKYGPRSIVILGNKLDLEEQRIVPKEQVNEFIARVKKTWKFNTSNFIYFLLPFILIPGFSFSFQYGSQIPLSLILIYPFSFARLLEF